jgi:hypothetical protein
MALAEAAKPATTTPTPTVKAFIFAVCLETQRRGVCESVNPLMQDERERSKGVCDRERFVKGYVKGFMGRVVERR